MLALLTRRIAAALLLWSFLIPGLAAQEKRDPADRLLEAQLLEVSTGDLEKAKAIYQEIGADEKAPEATRARALLYLARCHRKLGEIESAKKVLSDLLKSRTVEREVLRQAQSYLRELTGGKPESPDFDWLKEIERSPEIQSRVFDLAMDLVDPSSDAGKRARHQLLALGSVAVPVVEKVIETTRDPRHRQSLGLVLVHSGRFERLPQVLDSRFPPEGALIGALQEFRKSIPALADDERRRLIEALRKLPLAVETDPFRDVLLFAAGDTSDLPRKLPAMEGLGQLSPDLLTGILDREPGAGEAFADRILDARCQTGYRMAYGEALLKKAPEKLTAAHWGRLLSANNPPKEKYFQVLEERGSFDILAQLAAEGDGGVQEEINYFQKRYPLTDRQTASAVPAGWAAVLRAGKEKSTWLLHKLAAFNDGAVAEFTAFLRNREKEVPNYLTFHHELVDARSWGPSSRYLAAMAGLLDSRDPKTLMMALDAIFYAPVDAPGEVFQAVEKLLKESGDAEVRRQTLKALLKRFESHPETGPALAKALFAEFERASGGPEKGSEPPRAPSRPGRVAAVPRKRLPDTEALGEAIKGGGGERLLALYPAVVALLDSPAGGGFHAWYFEILAASFGDYKPGFEALSGMLDSVKSREGRESIVERILWPAKQRYKSLREGAGPLRSFLESAASDASLSPETRLKALRWPDPPAFEWVDWPRAFASGDPLAGLLLGEKETPEPGPRFWQWVLGRPEAEKAAIFHAALKSPDETVRSLAVASYPSRQDDVPQVLAAALEDPSDMVQSAAIAKLGQSSRADVAPLLIRVLKEKPARRLETIEVLSRFADPASIEPLVKLLGDPDVAVRGKTLAALRDIRQSLEEKRQWEEIVKGRKGEPPPKPKEP
jgi:tetratricopeptide (TPR) repeat protein